MHSLPERLERLNQVKRIDKIITSKTFNFIPNLIIKLWSPVSNRQHFLRRIAFIRIFDDTDPEWDAYMETNDLDMAHEKYGCRANDCICLYPNDSYSYEVTLSSNSCDKPKTAACEVQLHANNNLQREVL